MVPVVVGREAVAGLRARYYTIDAQLSICRTNRFARDTMMLMVEQTEDALDHPVNNAYG